MTINQITSARVARVLSGSSTPFSDLSAMALNASEIAQVRQYASENYASDMFTLASAESAYCANAGI
jgi:hypothetical protein